MGKSLSVSLCVCPVYIDEYVHEAFEICRVRTGVEHLGRRCLSNRNGRCCFLQFKSVLSHLSGAISCFMELEFDLTNILWVFWAWEVNRPDWKETKPGILSKRGDCLLPLPEEFMTGNNLL